MDNAQHSQLNEHRSVCGIDPSLTGLSVCSLLRDMTPVFCNLTSVPADGVEGRIARYERLATEVIVELEVMRPLVLFIEGYAYGSTYRSEALAEFGGILRSRILALLRSRDWTCTIREIAPVKLKQFAAGKGNAKKPQVAAGLRERYGQAFYTDDENDAYALARLAACYHGWDKPIDPVQLAVMEAIDAESPKVVKARRKATRKKEPRLF